MCVYLVASVTNLKCVYMLYTLNPALISLGSELGRGNLCLGLMHANRVENQPPLFNIPKLFVYTTFILFLILFYYKTILLYDLNHYGHATVKFESSFDFNSHGKLEEFFEVL